MAAPAHPPAPGTIRIDSNESVYGPTATAREAAVASMNDAERYPLDGPRVLGDAIARRFDLDPARITCGSGSDDLLARLARVFLRAGDELVYPVHGYQKIPNYAHANDATPVPADDREFTADIDAIIDRLNDRTRMVMLANPDNPTGTFVTGKEIRRLHAALPPSVLLVLDSAYAEYVDTPEYELPDRLVEESDNVVMTRTFSKVFGLAGMRIGWLYGPPRIIDLVTRVGITFPLSAPSLAASLAALEDEEHTRFVVRENAAVREAFVSRLSALGLTVFPSQTNFVLARFAGGAEQARGAQEWLESNGVLPRRLAAGDFADCIRFTIGSAAEMTRTAELLTGFLS